MAVIAAGANAKPRDNDILHLAAAQSSAGLAGSSARLDWLEHQLQTHAKAKFDLLVLPELFACGYNIGDVVKRVAEPVDEPNAMQMAAQAIGPDGAQLGRRPTLLRRLLKKAACKPNRRDGPIIKMWLKYSLMTLP